MSLEKLEEIAKQKADAISKERDALKAKQDAESKGAAESKEAEKKETEGSILKEKTDEEIINGKDEELSDVEKTKKVELLKKKEESLSPEEKIKKIQEASQRRIDELVGQIKELKDNKSKDTEAVVKLTKELDSIKQALKPVTEQDTKTKLQTLQSQRIAKYIAEDKSKPREQRREMSKEDLEEFMLDDLVAAQEWMVERNLRRRDEQKEDAEISKPKVNEKEVADEFIKKQQASLNKLIDTFPSLKMPKEFIEKHKGKSADELDVLYAAESTDYKLMMDILTEDNSYFTKENGPELVMTEMQKRKGKSTSDNDLKARLAAAEAEINRLKGLDEGLSSKGEKGKVTQQQGNKVKLTDEQIRVATKARVPTEALEKVLERRSKISGAGAFHTTGADGKRVDD